MATTTEPDPDREMRALLSAAGSPGQLEAAFADLDPNDACRILGDVLSPERQERIRDVVAGRTFAIATVVEGAVNTGNISAIMRTAEALGFQPFHVISGAARFKHSTRTTQGAQKWLDVYEWEDPQRCADALRESGYQIIVTHLDANSAPLETIDFKQKTAVVFGNELNGVSDQMLAAADQTTVIPTTGFVQSFNISVAAAVVLHQAAEQRRSALGASGDLTESEKSRLTAEFYFRATASAEEILARAIHGRASGDDQS